MMISGGQIMRLTGLILRSSLEEKQQTELLDNLSDLQRHEVDDLVAFLEMSQLDLTQLNVYTNTDISKRLDYIEKKENM